MKTLCSKVFETAFITENPVIYKQTISAENVQLWKKIMKKNLIDYKKLNIWNLINLPSERKAINGRWTYLIKPKKTNEKYEKKKIQWVAKKFLQQYGINYFKIFAHTAKSILFRLLFVFAVYFGWFIFQWNIIATFMTAELAKDIYVVQSTEYSDGINWICKLNTALNDFKQFACVWTTKLAKILIKFGLVQNPIDQSVFIDEDIAVVAHVNDLLIFNKSVKTVEKLKAHIKKYVKITDLKQTKTYLNIEILREDKTLILTQRKFTQQFLNKFASQVKSFKNPCLQRVKLKKNSVQVFVKNIKKYQQQIGSLMYLMTCIKLDLCYSIELFARFMTNSSENQFKALNQIWKYFTYIKNFGLHYSFENLNFINYCDADWERNFNTKKSIINYIFLFKNDVITWKSTLQKTITLFFIKAEYMEFKKIIKKSIFLQQFLKSVFFLKKYNARQLYMNNKSTKVLFKNPLFHKKTKHINI